ncbi:FAD-binding oxidoreductase [Rhodohalobacter sp. SW132]|uniref:NAD(P)/FAD-dependent oxidoreductase n=1 Tax=Rhodohalobacter sp. SW132 TaxID=2293433 RepID=UPI000E24C673|nr:FAD-dependent oxidoreductase [Rhodohalobacter sp. SW132]REL33621.1 FAD-binding oxidoreductase [Rhodohalobacter sp. SW132]
MSTSASDFDVTILGAGIAGLAAADALLQRQVNVAIIDTGLPGGGSSGAPLVLINPATGRRAKLVEHAEESIIATEDLLKRTAKFAGEIFYSKNGVLRPALTKDLADDFRRSPDKYDWPGEDWISWLDKEPFEKKYPWFGEHSGGLEIPHAFTVVADRYIEFLTDYLRSKGLQTFFETDYNINTSEDQTFSIDLENGRSFSTKAIIYAAGSAITQIPEWDFLPANSIKGQLLDLTFAEELPFNHSVSSMGYFAFNPATPHRLVAGSTYEHHYTHLDTDKEGETYLYKKLERTFPGLPNRRHSKKMWAGERVSLNDHKPVIGAHPELKNRYIIGGLGSKGIIYSPHLAKQLSDLVLDGRPVDLEFSPSRFLDH